VVIRPQVLDIGPADFNQRTQAIAEGEKAALAAMPQIRERIAQLQAERGTLQRRRPRHLGTLYQRQRELLVGRASDEFLQAQDEMGMTPTDPALRRAQRVLGAATGWTLIGVEGLLPELDFFDHLANRRFPVTWWIRRPTRSTTSPNPTCSTTCSATCRC
jgi:phenylalanine-4-hydroxylase